MKLICDGLDLSDAVLKVSKALPSKTANPVLEGIKIAAKNDSLILTATDTELTIEKTIKADVLMEGETVVVGKYFVDFAKKLEKEQVELSCLYDGQLQIKYSDSESELQVYPVANFPAVKKADEENYFELSPVEFKDVVEKTVLSCSNDDSRPILKGVLFEVSENTLTAVSLDGFRMSVLKKEITASGTFKAVIPARTLMEISRLIEKDEGSIKIYIQKNSLYLQIESTVIISRLIEGEFVKYGHILPTTFSNTFTVEKDALLNSLERATIVAKNDRYNVVRFDIRENVMTVSAKSEVGFVNENVNINLEGKDTVIAFNAKFLSEYLRIIKDEFIKFKLNSSIDPCILTPAGKEDFIYLVLPVSINV